MTTAFKADKSSKQRNVIRDGIIRIYRTAADNCFSQQQVNECLRVLYDNAEYDRIQYADRLYLHGVADTMYGLHWSNLVFSYEVDGVRMSIESEEYKAIPPQYVNEHCSHTGQWVYRKDLSKAF